MLNDVFLELVKSDFIKAIEKHAKKASVSSEDVQIQIKLDAEQGLKYAIFNQWKQRRANCTFKDVMCIQLDVFNKEGMLSPHIHEMLIKQVEQYECDPENFYAFLFKRNNTVGCALYVGIDNVRTCPLSDLFT